MKKAASIILILVLLAGFAACTQQTETEAEQQEVVAEPAVEEPPAVVEEAKESEQPTQQPVAEPVVEKAIEQPQAKPKLSIFGIDVENSDPHDFMEVTSEMGYDVIMNAINNKQPTTDEVAPYAGGTIGLRVETTDKTEDYYFVSSAIDGNGRYLNADSGKSIYKIDEGIYEKIYEFLRVKNSANKISVTLNENYYEITDQQAIDNIEAFINNAKESTIAIENTYELVSPESLDLSLDTKGMIAWYEVSNKTAEDGSVLIRKRNIPESKNWLLANPETYRYIKGLAQ